MINGENAADVQSMAENQMNGSMKKDRAIDLLKDGIRQGIQLAIRPYGAHAPNTTDRGGQRMSTGDKVLVIVAFVTAWIALLMQIVRFVVVWL